uniref:Uncharacterized protein n=1 Tax=Eutreptiella gymnastica TaxID=73025 RepID=A0A7S4LIZ4_9EUGL
MGHPGLPDIADADAVSKSSSKTSHAPGAMTSGFELPRMILTSCQTHSAQCSQIVLPSCHCSANQSSTECCIEFTARGGYRMFHGLSGSALPLPTAPGSHKASCTQGRTPFRNLHEKGGLEIIAGLEHSPECGLVVLRDARLPRGVPFCLIRRVARLPASLRLRALVATKEKELDPRPLQQRRISERVLESDNLQ